MGIRIFNTGNVVVPSKDYYHKTLRDRYSIEDEIEINNFVYFIDDGQKTLFNAGFSEKFPFGLGIYGKLFSRYYPAKNLRSIYEQLREEGIGGVDKVVLSHLHIDHISGLLDMPEGFVRDGIYAHPKEIDAAKKSRLIYPSKTLKGLDIKPLREQDDFIELPGHTPGHIGLKYGKVILAGDALETPVSLSNFEFAKKGAPFADEIKFKNSLRGLVESSKNDYLVLSNHDSGVFEGDLDKLEEGLRCRQQDYIFGRKSSFPN